MLRATLEPAMCFSKPPKPPSIQQAAPIPPPVSTAVIDQDAVDQKARERTRLRAAAGRSSTVLTAGGSQGVSTPTGGSRTLLGS